MNPAIKKRLTRTLIFSIIALVIGGGVGYVQVQMQDARVVKHDSKADPEASSIAGLQVGGPFSLTNQDGEAVTEKNYDGQYKFIYFGFTYCPAICPTELQKMSRVMTALEKKNPQLADKVQPLFITIDPERDTVPVMSEYISLFHPRFEALTGTLPQVDFVKKSYRIFGNKVQEENMNDYTMDHSTFLYLMGPDNTMATIYRMTDTADEIYDDIIKRISPENSVN